MFRWGNVICFHKWAFEGNREKKKKKKKKRHKKSLNIEWLGHSKK